MHDLQVHQDQETQIERTIVWVDNTSALAVATGSDFTHETVKHVIVKVRFIQECVQHKLVRFSYVATRKNISDVMTKQSVGPQFISHRESDSRFYARIPWIRGFIRWSRHLRWNSFVSS